MQEVPMTYDTKQLCDNIPQDVNDHIYQEFFLLKPTCDTYLKWLEDNSDLSKNPEEVYDLANILVNSNVSVEYLISKNPIIKKTYQDHFVDNNKNFKLMNNINSFTTSILMHMWH